MQIHNTGKFTPADPLLLITLCWSLGISLGIWFGPAVSYPLSQFLKLACYRCSGFTVLSAVLPLIMIWLALWRSLKGLVYPILFLKAFMDGILIIALSYAFSASAWVIGAILLISDRVGTFALLYTAALGTSSERFSSHKPIVIALIAVSAVSLLDHLYISPYLLTLMP